ncbi:MAG: hypothetical protein HY645_09390 [Acidobacteria bacterium]|nr:hypothetical protein [Acidobacteriota bacterium]
MRSVKPELKAQKQIAALERRKAQADALIEFIKVHPTVAAESILWSFAHRTGLMFPNYALIRPLWSEGKPTLRLEKYSEQWFDTHPEEDPLDFTKRTVCVDVSNMPENELLPLLDNVHREIAPEDFEAEEDESEEDG